MRKHENLKETLILKLSDGNKEPYWHRRVKVDDKELISVLYELRDRGIDFFKLTKKAERQKIQIKDDFW